MDTPQTGQTGQKVPPWVEVAQDEEGKWHWCLWSSNGRQLATNIVPYERQKDAVQAYKNAAEAFAEAKVVAKG